MQEKIIKNKVKDTKTLTLQAFLDDFTFNTLKDANKRDVTKLKNAMRKRGWTSPVFTWQKFVVDGTGRRKAVVELLEEGYTFPGGIPYVEVEAKDMAEAKQLALDFSSQHGYITKDSFLEYTADFEVDFETMQIAGFDKDKFIDTNEKDDEVPETPTDPQSKLGDLYELGEHRVLCGDSTKIEDVERLMDGKKADMVFTDPPYGMKLNADYSGMKGWHQGKKYDNVIGDHADFNNDFINNIFSVFKDTKEKFLWGADYYVDLLPDFGKTGAWIVWDKRVDESKDKMYGSGFEMLWSQEKHQRRLLRGQWAGFMGDAEARNRVHPTQKPTKILVEIMQEYCSSGEIVADLFLGSGSTLIAAEKTGRICYGMELDPKYIDVIISRYVEFTGNNKIKKNGIDIIWEIKK